LEIFALFQSSPGINHQSEFLADSLSLGLARGMEPSLQGIALYQGHVKESLVAVFAHP
jgi:hypothetical protein